MLKPTCDPSVTSGIGEAVRSLTSALDEFAQFPDRDLAAEDHARWARLLDQPLPKQGKGAEWTLAALRDEVIPRGLRIGAPGFAGWVTTMPTVVPAATAFAASIAGAQRYWVQPFNLLEEVALNWLKELLTLPAFYQGTFSSGGSSANLIGLAAARQWACEQQGVDASRDGLVGIGKPRIYVSDQVHHVVHRAAAVLGLGRRSLTMVPTDSAQRMAPVHLRKQLRQDRRDGCTPVAVVANAGNVNTGAVDPLAEILDICRDEGIWMHVDGAYGGFGVLDPEAADAFQGLTDVDSLAIDPHKWLAVPLGCGATFVRDRAVLGRALTPEPAEYLEGSEIGERNVTSQFDGMGIPFHDFNVEQSARSRGATVWAALSEIGAEGMRRRVRTHIEFAQHLAALVDDAPELELLAPVTLSICCFRYVPQNEPGAVDGPFSLNDLNREILKRLHAEARHVPSSTEIGGKFAIRVCYINPRTTRTEVDDLVKAVVRTGGNLWNAR